MKIGMTIWLHSNAETGELLYYEPFEITGENIPIDLLRYIMDDETRKDEIDCFSGMKPENCYYVVAEYQHDNYWYLDNIDGFVEMPDLEYKLAVLGGQLNDSSDEDNVRFNLMEEEE